MIQFTDVTKVYENGTRALDHVNLKIDDGEFVFIVGESGAGKTTLMKLLLREERLTSGSLRVGEYELGSMREKDIPYYRRRLGVVFQDFRLFEHMTVFENVAFAMHAIGEPNKEIKKKVPIILSVVNLGDKQDNFPNELSGGEQQRVALARALANNPRYLIADEPTGNIDPRLSREIMTMLVRIQKMGKTVIVVTHEKSLVDDFRQRVVTIRGGRIESDRVGEMFS